MMITCRRLELYKLRDTYVGTKRDSYLSLNRGICFTI